jgi:hypothetical protein
MTRIYRFPYAQARIGVIPEMCAMRRHRRSGNLGPPDEVVVSPRRAAGQATSVSVVAALVCHRSNHVGPVTVEWTFWDSVGQTREAESELTPCGEWCIGVHSVVTFDLVEVGR